MKNNKTNRFQTSLTIALALASWAVSPFAANAQDGGRLVTLSFSSGLNYEADDGEPSETTWQTRLNGVVFSETRSQRFRIAAGGLLEVTDDDSDITDSNASVDYAWFNRDTELAVGASFASVAVDEADLDDDFDGSDLTDDDGRRDTAQANITLTTGRAARFGTTTELLYRERTFDDVTDPDLIDNIVMSAATTLRFTLDRRIEMRVFGSWQETEEQDAVNETETIIRYGVAGDFLIDRAWTLGLSLASVETETETTVAPLVEEQGFQFNANLTRFMPNGRLVFSLTLDREDDDEEVNTFTVARSLELANGAAVSASLGAVSFEDGDVLGIFSVSYENEILRGRTLSFALSQTGGENDDDENILRTRLAATYRQDLTRNSSIALTGTLAAVDVLEGVTDDTTRASLGVRYTHDLTRDWSLVASATQSVTYEDGDRTDRGEVFSINLQRTFSFRP